MSVYFVRCGDDGPIKIGYAKDVERRLASLQTSSPFPLVLIGSIDGTRDDERILHRHFDADRLNGEWFTSSEVLMAFLHDRFGYGKSLPKRRNAQPADWPRRWRKGPAPDELTIADAAAYTSVEPRIIAKFVKAGELRTIPDRDDELILRVDVESWVDSKRIFRHQLPA